MEETLNPTPQTQTPDLKGSYALNTKACHVFERRLHLELRDPVLAFFLFWIQLRGDFCWGLGFRV